MTPEGLIGMPAKAFSSVSMDPPLVMRRPARAFGRYLHFANAGHVAVHVLGSQGEELAMAFARSGQAFDGRDLLINDNGVPLLGNCLARFECTTQKVYDAGDHGLIPGRVKAATFRDGEASQGRFRRFDKEV